MESRETAGHEVPIDWEEIGAILDAVLDLDEAGRQEYLERELGTEPEVRSRVERLLDAEANAGCFLEPPAGATLASTGPQRVGPFRLERVLGQGGMGTVWLGSRDGDDFEQQVAVKLLRPEAATAQGVARFLRERRLLAQLEHPGVARLIDGGTTEDGQPYLALEYVDGTSVDTYVQEHGLDLRGRIDLFIAVCEAVSVAHGLAIAHRDLKPSNVLVTAEGQPKLIDFGIARGETGDHNLEPTVTLSGQRVMTPRYAAPEQILGEATGPVTDVHGLGALLYKLLTGSGPVPAGAVTMAEIEEAVLEQVPPAPSRVPGAVPGISRDLDLIVLRSLAKEPERRYPDAASLLRDLEAYLEGRPIRARPDSRVYRARRFMVRHRVLVGAASGVFLALGVGLVLALSQYRKAEARGRETRDALAEADAQRITAEAVNAFMTDDLMPAADPERSGEPDLPLREAMDRAEPRIAERFSMSPLAEAAVRQAYGSAYLGLSLPDRAEPQLARAFALRITHLGPLDIDTLKSGRDLARTLELLNRLDECITLTHQVRDAMVTLLGEHDGDTMVVTGNLANVYRRAGRLEEAEGLMRRLLELRLEAFGEHHENTLTTYNSLAVLMLEMERLEEALPLARKAADLRAELLGPTAPATLRSRGNLAATEYRLGDYDAAHASYEEILEAQREVLGPAHLDTITTLRNLGVIAYTSGRPEYSWRWFRYEWQGWNARGVGTGERGLALLASLVSECAKAEQLEEGVEVLAGWLDATDPEDEDLRGILEEHLTQAESLLYER